MADAPLTAGLLNPIDTTEGNAISDECLLHFTDADPDASVSDYVVTVNWGDGVTDRSDDPDPQVHVAADPDGGFDVMGSHTFQAPVDGDTYTVTVADGSQTISASSPPGQPATPSLTTSMNPNEAICSAYGDGTYPDGRRQVQFGGIPGDGSGQTIGIIVPTTMYLSSPGTTFYSDAQVFDSSLNGSPGGYYQVKWLSMILMQNGVGTPEPPIVGDGWELETANDMEWAHAMAPKANILVVGAYSQDPADMFAAAEVAIANGASVVSMSYGFPDSEYAGPNGTLLGSQLAQWDSLFASYPNVTFVAASGDYGAYGGTEDQDSPLDGAAAYPATSPYVLSVGGTVLNLNSDGTYASETAWPSSGGGSGIDTHSGPDVAAVADDGLNAIVAFDWWQEYYEDLTIPSSFAYGGTSLAAPIWAGLIAVANQGRSLIGLPPLGDQALSYLGNPQWLASMDMTSPLPSTDFHQISPVGETGRGSPIANLLLPDLAPTSVATPLVTLSPACDSGESDTDGITNFNDSPGKPFVFFVSNPDSSATSFAVEATCPNGTTATLPSTWTVSDGVATITTDGDTDLANGAYQIRIQETAANGHDDRGILSIRRDQRHHRDYTSHLAAGSRSGFQLCFQLRSGLIHRHDHHYPDFHPLGQLRCGH